MIALFTAFASIPKPVKQALAVLAAALLAWGAFTLYVNGVRRAAVKADRVEAVAKAKETAERATEAATGKNEAIQQTNAANDAATRKAIDDAAIENPDAAKAPAGVVTRRSIDSLRGR